MRNKSEEVRENPPSARRRVPKLRFPEFRQEEEWKEKRFGNVLSFQAGFPFASPNFTEEHIGLRLIRNRDLKSDDKIIFYSGSFDEQFIVVDGDVLVGMDGDFTPFVWNKGKALLNQRVGRIIPHKGSSKQFLYYYLTVHLKVIEEVTARTTVKHLSHTDVVKISEPLPALTEQQKIADCLSSLDDLIAAHTQKYDALKTHKKGLMQQLFPTEGEIVPKLRFPEFKDAEEWCEKFIDEVFDYCSTANNSRADLSSQGGVYYVHYGDIHTKYNTYIDFTRDEVPKISEKLYKSATLLKNGDLILADASEDTDGIAKPIEVIGLSRENRAISGLHTILLRDKEKQYVDGFRGRLFEINTVREQVQRLAVGVKVYSISKRVLCKVIIPKPSPPEQQKIASCLSSLDHLIASQSQKIDSLKLHKKALMQQLFPAAEEVGG